MDFRFTKGSFRFAKLIGFLVLSLLGCPAFGSEGGAQVAFSDVAKPTYSNDKQIELMFQFASAGDFEPFKYLIDWDKEHHADKFINARASLNYNITILMHAVINGREKMVKYLLAHGADITLHNDQGWNALAYALSPNSADTQEMVDTRARITNMLLKPRAHHAQPAVAAGDGKQNGGVVDVSNIEVFPSLQGIQSFSIALESNQVFTHTRTYYPGGVVDEKNKTSSDLLLHDLAVYLRKTVIEFLAQNPHFSNLKKSWIQKVIRPIIGDFPLEKTTVPCFEECLRQLFAKQSRLDATFEKQESDYQVVDIQEIIRDVVAERLAKAMLLADGAKPEKKTKTAKIVKEYNDQRFGKAWQLSPKETHNAYYHFFIDRNVPEEFAQSMASYAYALAQKNKNKPVAVQKAVIVYPYSKKWLASISVPATSAAAAAPIQLEFEDEEDAVATKSKNISPGKRAKKQEKKRKQAAQQQAEVARRRERETERLQTEAAAQQADKLRRDAAIAEKTRLKREQDAAYEAAKTALAVQLKQQEDEKRKQAEEAKQHQQRLKQMADAFENAKQRYAQRPQQIACLQEQEVREKQERIVREEKIRKERERKIQEQAEAELKAKRDREYAEQQNPEMVFARLATLAFQPMTRF